MKLIPFAVILAIIAIHSIPAENDRLRHAPYKILISEIKILHQSSDFVEVGKICPTPGRSNYFTGLDGYYILIITGSSQLNIHSAYNLDGKHLTSEIPASNDGLPMLKKRGRKRTRTNANPGTSNVNDENILSSDGRTTFTNSVPPGRTLASAHVPTQRLPRSVRIEFENLLHTQPSQIGDNTTETTPINHFKGRKTRSNRNIKYNPLSYFYETIPTNLHHSRDEIIVGNTITTKDIASIGTKLKDVVLIGSEIPEAIKNDLRKIHDKLFETSLIPVSENKEITSFSINKCDQSPDIFNTIAYQYSVPTPGRPNSCTQLYTEEANYPYGFAGQTIKSHGQKSVINVLWSLQNKNIQEILKKGPINAASALLNLNEDTIKRFQKRYEENSIGIETEKKNPPKPVQDVIDESKQRMLYEILVSYYKANKVPRMNEVREKFIQKVRTEQLQNPTSEIPTTLFHCGMNTFRKILYSNGYKYGKINKRDAVLFDPRIVAWRGKYLKAIQDNDVLDDGAKLPVIYTDETWLEQLYWDGDLQFELAMDKNGEMELAAIATDGDNIEILNTEPEDEEDSQDEAGPSKLPRMRE
ncbi:unnamed protein product [Allacma fusca]|uniref:Uncharacterized protein n=1 Tax=Allacma fusca TaxID=39272 RepID=A0A8J2KM54_9HEXA|nr:unnamed protein product [Allacma fusca]